MDKEYETPRLKQIAIQQNDLLDSLKRLENEVGETAVSGGVISHKVKHTGITDEDRANAKPVPMPNPDPCPHCGRYVNCHCE